MNISDVLILFNWEGLKGWNVKFGKIWSCYILLDREFHLDSYSEKKHVLKINIFDVFIFFTRGENYEITKITRPLGRKLYFNSYSE